MIAALLNRLRAAAFWRGDAGAAAAEFAMIIPALLVMSLGTINLGVMMYGYVTLHFAAEDTARCLTVKTSTCKDATTTTTYGRAHYKGPMSPPTFVATTPACGNMVVASGTYHFATGVMNILVPMRATACHPLS